MTAHDPTVPAPDSGHASPLSAPEITEAECRRCGTLIAGLDGRYACGVCGWVNDHSEGHRRLPRADEDPDRPRGRRTPRPARTPRPGKPAPPAGALPDGTAPADGEAPLPGAAAPPGKAPLPADERPPYPCRVR